MSKNSWPELVGMTWEEGRDRILEIYPNIAVQVVPEGSFVTMDFREDRVRLTVDEAGKITAEPHIG